MSDDQLEALFAKYIKTKRQRNPDNLFFWNPRGYLHEEMLRHLLYRLQHILYARMKQTPDNSPDGDSNSEIQE